MSPTIDAVPAAALRRREMAIRIGIVTASAAPALVALIAVIGSHWMPNDDQAVQVLRISDVGTGHTPLLGAWSRWAWNHPGPLQPWLTAPFFHVLGNDGVLVATALFAVASSAGAAWIGLRRGGVVLGSLVALIVCLLVGALGLSTVVNPWNPYVALLPYFLFLLLVWAVACDDVMMLPVAAAVGTFCVQAHVGYVVLVGGMGAFACIAVLVRRVLEHNRRTGPPVSAATPLPIEGEPAGNAPSSGRSGWSPWRRTIAAFIAAGIVAILLWAPAIVDQLWGSRNLSALLRFSLHPSDPATGWAESARIMSAQLWVPPPWIDANDATLLGLPRTAPLVLGLVALVTVAMVALATAWARRWTASLLGVTAFVAIVAAVASTARLTGTRYPYLVRWWWIVAAFAWLSVGWGVLVLVRADRRRLVAGVLIALAVATTVGVGVRDLPIEPPNPTSSEAMTHLIGPVAQRLDRQGRYVVRAKDDLNLFGAGRGLLLGLEKDGYQAYLEPDELTPRQVGSWRTLPAADSDGILLVVGLDALDAGFRPAPGSKRLAVFDPLDSAERREFAQLQEEVRSALGAKAEPGVIPITSPYVAKQAVDAGVPVSDVQRMTALQARGSGYAVYLEPTTTP